MPILNGADGSRLRAPSATQIQAKNGAKTMMQTGLIDWYQEAGCDVLGEHAAEPGAIGVVERERVERGCLLFEAAPEQRRAQEENDDDADALLFDGM